MEYQPKARQSTNDWRNCNDRYAYRVTWSDEDEMFVGLCAEFGLLSHLDDTPEKAFSGIRDVVAFAVKALDGDGTPVPEPLKLASA